MKEQETREKFIELRAEGISFDKISQRIGVTKATLLEWSRKYADEINEFKLIRYENILHKYQFTQKEKVERLAKELSIAWAFYESKSYDNIPKSKLIAIIMKMEQRLAEITEPVKNLKNIKKEEDRKKEPGLEK